jgi:hypothetical protein
VISVALYGVYVWVCCSVDASRKSLGCFGAATALFASRILHGFSARPVGRADD